MAEGSADEYADENAECPEELGVIEELDITSTLLELGD